MPEARGSAAKARERGAVAASACGAGFGGRVWAMVDESKADEFTVSRHI